MFYTRLLYTPREVADKPCRHPDHSADQKGVQDAGNEATPLCHVQKGDEHGSGVEGAREKLPEIPAPRGGHCRSRLGGLEHDACQDHSELRSRRESEREREKKNSKNRGVGRERASTLTLRTMNMAQVLIAATRK